jgi:hypothetical protein
MLAHFKSKMISAFRQQLLRIDSGLRGGVRPECEVIYQNIVDRDLAALSIPNRFYPLNAAANYGLLYLILRSAQELDIQSVVELGAGQSSLLIDALRKCNAIRGDALTIDHDADWATRTSTIVSHQVATAPLITIADKLYTYEGYDLSKVHLPERIDLLIIDGPIGWGEGRAYARHGALPILERLDADGFLVIVDDAEREKALVSRIYSLLNSKGIKFKAGRILASKRQDFFASGKMAAAAFY